MSGTGSGKGIRWAYVGVVIVLVVAAGIFAVLIGTGSAKVPQRIQIEKVSSDQVDAPLGHSYYLIDLNVSNAGPVAWNFNPAFLEMTSNSSLAYSMVSSYNSTSLLGKFSLPQMTHVVGPVVFELPISEAPSRLQYRDSNSSVNLDVGNVPQVSAVASRFNLNVRLTINGELVNGWLVTTPFNGTDQWVRAIISTSVIENNSLVFFTGQTVQVNLWFEYLKKPLDPATITLQSVSAGNGFQTVKVDGALPLAMTGWGTASSIVLLLRVPPGEQSGKLNVSVQFSA